MKAFNEGPQLNFLTKDLVLRLNVERERSSIFSFMRDLSYIASLLFTNVNFTLVRT